METTPFLVSVLMAGLGLRVKVSYEVESDNMPKYTLLNSFLVLQCLLALKKKS